MTPLLGDLPSYPVVTVGSGVEANNMSESASFSSVHLQHLEDYIMRNNELNTDLTLKCHHIYMKCSSSNDT